MPFKLALRIPDWCHHFSLRVNGQTTSADVQRGYALIDRVWSNGDRVELSLTMPVERIASHPNVRHNAGCIALQRGPIIYCLEEVDNGANLANVIVPREAKLVGQTDSGLFGGVGVITGEGTRIEPATWAGGLYQPQSQLQYTTQPISLKAIPYSLWANREPGEMRVWLREQ